MAYLTEELTKKTFDKRIPFDVSLELTRRCNQKCAMCYQPHKEYTEMDTVTVKKVLRILADAQCLFCTFTGGEPLLRNDTPELIDFAANNGFAVTLKTNGTLLDPQTINKIAASCIMEVHLSLLGGTAAVHDKMTGMEGSFEKTCTAIKNLQKSGINTVIMSVITPDSLYEMEAIYDIAQCSGIDNVNFSAIVFPKTPTDPDVNTFRLNESELVHYYEILEDIYNYDVESESSQPSQDERFLSCTAIQSGITITPDGTVYPCSSVPISLGNIVSDSLESVLFSPLADSIIKKLQLSSTPECATCIDNHHCLRCPGLGFMDDGVFSTVPYEACRHTQAFKTVTGHIG